MLKNLWEEISSSGVSQGIDYRLKKRIRIINRVIVMAFLISLVFGLVNLYHGYYELALYSFGSLLGHLLLFFIHRRGYYDVSRYGVIINALWNIVFFSSIHGEEHGTHYFLITALMGLFAIFTNRERTKLMISILLVFGAWLTLEITDYSTFSHLKPDDANQGWLRILNLGATFVSTLLVMHYYTRETAISERELNEKKEHLRTVVNSTDNGIWLLNRNYELVLYNQTFAVWCEGFFDKVVNPGDNIINLFAAEDSELKTKLQEKYNDVFSTGKMKAWEELYEIKGRKLYLEVVLNPVHVEGKVVALSGYGRDMTKRKRIELELKEAKAKAEDASRAKSMFLSNLSHELRTPLNAIYGVTQLISRSNKDDSLNENLDIILKSTEHLTELINNLLDFSSMQDGTLRFKYKQFFYRNAVQLVTASHKRSIEKKNIGLQVETDSELPDEVIGDAGRFIQVLRALVDNAVKYTYEGQVTIKSGVSESDKNKLTVRVSVQDTGSGIPKEKQKELFESFYQVDSRGTRKYEGVGLGLPIAKKIVEAEGGSIYCNSTLGKGSEFTFELPFKLPENNTPVVKKQVPKKINNNGEGKNNKHILVVDDNQVNRLIAKQLLNRLNFNHISLAESGKQAMEIFNGELPEVVLLDIHMPEMDGYEVAALIRNSDKGRDIPIIAVSADIIPETKEKAKACGMDDFIEKPVKLEILRDVLKRHLSRSR